MAMFTLLVLGFGVVVGKFWEFTRPGGTDDLRRRLDGVAFGRARGDRS